MKTYVVLDRYIVAKLHFAQTIYTFSWHLALACGIMQQFWIFIFVLSSTLAERIDLLKLYKEAENDVLAELKAQMVLGANSPRFDFRKENTM